MITVLAGGVGAARFLEGLVQVVAPADVTVIVNTGDDEEFFGLHVSPDIDTVVYTLAGRADPEQGWGLAGDTFACLEALARLGHDTWFRLGDADLATHIHRTSLLRQGRSLSEATASIAAAFGLEATVLPMSDDFVRTEVITPSGVLPFQEYFVRRGFQDPVQGLRFQGAESARPTPGVLESVASAAAIILAPSNPLVSIGPILAVPGIREALGRARAAVAAVSPIVAGRTIKGPADRMMAGLGLEVSARGVAELYRDFLDIMVLDSIDEALAPQIRSLGIATVVTNTLMRSVADKEALAAATLRALGQEPCGSPSSP
jgi:LPPG:FO 2-phospho-L-lactate transferase